MTVRKQSFLQWAYDHSHPDHQKYSTIKHASYITITGTIIFLIITLIANHLIFSSSPDSLLLQCTLDQSFSSIFGYFLLIYLIFMIVSRYSQNGSVAIYQFLWACNQALLIGAIGMILQDSNLMRVSIVVVSIDQLLWYIDLTFYVVKGKFVIGVAKYIVWPQTTRLRLMTTFHHVWYIPLVMWLTVGNVSMCGLSWKVYGLSCVMSLALALIGRISTPKQVIIPNNLKHKSHHHDSNSHKKKQQDQNSTTRTVYLNLNLSWQLWKDIKSGFLTRCYEVLPQKTIPMFLSMFWNAGNFFGFIILVGIEKIYA